MSTVVLLPCSAGNSASPFSDTSNPSRAIVDVDERYVNWQEDWTDGVRWFLLAIGNDIGRKNWSGDLE